MEDRELGRLMRVARDKAEREITAPQFLPGTVVQIVQDDDTLPYPYARVHLDGPHPQHVTNDVMIIGSMIPTEGDRVMVRYDPPHGMTIGSSESRVEDVQLIPTARATTDGFEPPAWPPASDYFIPPLRVNEWDRIVLEPSGGTVHAYDDMEVDAAGLVVPTAGVYSANAQVIIEHWSRASVSDAANGAQFWEEGSTTFYHVIWEVTDGYVGEIGWHRNDDDEIDGLGCDYNGLLTSIQATVPFLVDGGVTPDHDLTAEVLLKVGGVTVASETKTVVADGADSISVGAENIVVFYTGDEATVIHVEIRVTGDFGTQGCFVFIQQTGLDDGFLDATRAEPVRQITDGGYLPLVETYVGLVVQSPDALTFPGFVNVGVTRIEHVGQVTNVAFGCEADDIIECWVYVHMDVAYGTDDVRVMKRAVADTGLIVDVIATGYETSQNLQRWSELSAHWVRDADVDHGFSIPS